MELNITEFAKNYNYIQAYNPIYGSIATLGNNAAKLTWNNAKHFSLTNKFVTKENKKAIQSYFRDFGAWSKEEIEAWSTTELNALLLQEIASSLEEYLEYEEYSDYLKASEDGQVSGRIFESDPDAEGNKELFIYIGM